MLARTPLCLEFEYRSIFVLCACTHTFRTHIYNISHIQIHLHIYRYSNEHCLNCFHFEFDLRCFRSSVCISFGLLLFAYTVVVDNYALSQL